jgi:hypothetical protein
LSKVIFYTVLLIVLLSCEKSQKLEEIDVNNIKLSAWYDGKQCAFTFTFDDNTPKHKEIGDLLSRYNLKGSFFVNPGFSNFQEYKELYKKLIEDGHEIGNRRSPQQPTSPTHSHGTGPMRMAVPCKATRP